MFARWEGSFSFAVRAVSSGGGGFMVASLEVMDSIKRSVYMISSVLIVCLVNGMLVCSKMLL